MTARDFCYWLQGFFELAKAGEGTRISLTSDQAKLIERHLSLVFAHDIDPSFGSPAVQQKLNVLHDPNAVVRC